jgi:pimeloyl-ACP methyl ester carboxylesterase
MRVATVVASALTVTVLAAPFATGGLVQAPAVERAVPGAFAAVAGRQLWYLDTGGAGPAVILLHAASGSSLMWEQQLVSLRKAGYRAIAFDRAGWGRSPLSTSADRGTAADDLKALLAQLRLDRVHLVGTAAGGIVAIDYALSFPESVRSLTLANTIGGVQDESYLETLRRLRPVPQFDALPEEVRELGPSYRAGDAAGTARWIELSDRSRPGSGRPTAQPPRNRITFDRLATLRPPVLLITGGADLYAPPPIMRLFAERIRGAKTLVVPEAGHSVYWEAPDVFLETVTAFVNRY